MRLRKPDWRKLAAITIVLAASACASSPTRPVQPAPTPTPAATPAAPAPTPFKLTPTDYSALPDWPQADMAPALLAFRRHCAVLRQRAPDTTMPGQYGGKVGDWLLACSAADSIGPGQERYFFESYFYPAMIQGPGDAKLTAYFEPVIQASRTPAGALTEPLLKRPGDMVTIDLSAFAAVRTDDALRGAPRSLTGKIAGNTVTPYPKREAIAPASGQVIAYAHPADVYNLQVQGSGRLQFSDGQQTRAAFSAQNGYSWSSALAALRQTGQLASATWANFRSWMDSNPQGVRGALNADPSYVFFNEETIPDVTAGPKGAAGVPLTPMGSVAVDPAYHPYGAVVFVDGTYDNAPFRRLLVAQDTGGAIRRGPQRGDVFFGSGPQAGAAAERMNGAARWWTLLPRPPSTPIAAVEGVTQVALR